jgi:hypothetical protein
MQTTSPIDSSHKNTYMYAKIRQKIHNFGDFWSILSFAVLYDYQILYLEIRVETMQNFLRHRVPRPQKP